MPKLLDAQPTVYHDTDEDVYVSPPVAGRHAIMSGYRVGESRLWQEGTTAPHWQTEVLENSTGNAIAWANGDTEEESGIHAALIVSALNLVPR